MATKEETQGPKVVLWSLPQEAGLGEESAPEEGLTPGEPRPASPFVPVCLSLLQTANFPAQFPFPAETRRAELPFTGASKNQRAMETFNYSSLSVLWLFGNAVISSAENAAGDWFVLEPPRTWGMEAADTDFFHLYFLSLNKCGDSEASDVHISTCSEKGS